MKDAKIELKNVKTFRGREGIGLDADLVINGKKIAHVLDDARGGETNFDAYGKDHDEIKANRKILSELDEYVKSLPQKTWPASLGGGLYDQDLETFVNDLLAEKEKEKAIKAIQKKFVNHIILGVPGETAYRYLTFGNKKSPAALAIVPKDILQNSVNNCKTQLKAGEQILNTNLVALGIQI